MARNRRGPRIVRGIPLKAGQVVYLMRQDPSGSWPSETYLSITHFTQSLEDATLPTGSVWERLSYQGESTYIQVSGPENPDPEVQHPVPQVGVEIDNLPRLPYIPEPPKGRYRYA